MEHFLDYGMWDLYEVMFWVYETFNDFLDKVFEGEYGWLFYLAFFPGVLLFVFDLVMTFILSFRCRQLRLFNVFSLKSWNALRFRYNSQRDIGQLRLRFTGFSSFSLRLRKFKKMRPGDTFRSVDGTKFTYGGMRVDSNGQFMYSYRSSDGIFLSPLKPAKWAKLTRGQQLESITITYTDKNKKK